MRTLTRSLAGAVLIWTIFVASGSADPAKLKLLNVSYDATRELYQDIDRAFAARWEAKTGQSVTVSQSHGGSANQAQAVIKGLEADVVTLASAYDIDVIAGHAQLLPENWQARLPDNSSPYTSTVVFLVRSGNSKNIRDWDDLVRPGVRVIAPNPKTSGGARWNFLAAWGYSLHKNGGDESIAKDFVRRLYRNAPGLADGARAATDDFVQSGSGDVLVAWESEVLLTVKQFGADKFEIVNPSESILAEPPVAIVDKVVDRRGTRQMAQAYLDFLYSEEGQTIIAEHFYRPRMESVAAKFPAQFSTVRLFTIDETFGGWQKAQKRFFSDGGLFDQIYGAGP